MAERNVQQDIRLALGADPDVVLWRNQCGFYKESGRAIKYGVGSPGGADLIGIFRASDGRGIFIAVEVKTDTGRQSLEQKQFQALVERKGGHYALCRSADDARAFIARLRAL